MNGTRTVPWTYATAPAEYGIDAHTLATLTVINEVQQSYANHLWHETVTGAVASLVITYWIRNVPGLQERIGDSAWTLGLAIFAGAMAGGVLSDIADYFLFGGVDVMPAPSPKVAPTRQQLAAVAARRRQTK